jgi:hypothetical protein
VDSQLALDAQNAREGVISGVLQGEAFRMRLMAVPFVDRDAWVDAVFGIAEIPDDMPGLPRDAVPYLPCGVEEVLGMVAAAPIDAQTEFVDLGSGLGRVPMLVRLLTGARTLGIELQPTLVTKARSCARGWRWITSRFTTTT